MSILPSLVAYSLFSCAIAASSSSDPKDPSAYSNHVTLDSDGHFQLYWNFDDDTVTMQYHAQSRGWAGLGFSPQGAMIGADIALFWLDANGKGFVSDRHASQNGFPPEDKHQDYELINAAKNETHIIVTFTRKRNTCDLEDWALGDDTTRVIYAANDNIPIDADQFDKHTVRGSKSLHIFDQKPDVPDGTSPEEGATAIEFRVTNVSVPSNRETLYWCEFIQLPRIPEKKHIIKMEPMIQKENIHVVHHLLIYSCLSFNATPYMGNGAPCFEGKDTRMIQAFGQCQAMALAAWAVGGQSIIYPKDIGLPISNPDGDMFVMIEMHYDNALFQKGVVDSSGMRFWMTDHLRPIEAGKGSFGSDVGPLKQILPPGMNEIYNYGYCSAQCTRDLPEDGVKILGGLLHTHLTGRKIRLLHYRQGVQLPNIMADEYYDFNYQDYRMLDDPVTVLPLECKLLGDCKRKKQKDKSQRDLTKEAKAKGYKREQKSKRRREKEKRKRRREERRKAEEQRKEERRGDELVVECVYQTTDRNDTTLGGLETHDEMCLVYIDFYPAFTDNFVCLSTLIDQLVLNKFDDYDNETGTLAGCNPKNPYACLKAHQWQKDEIDRVLDYQRNGEHLAVCLTDVVNVTSSGNYTVPQLKWYPEKGYPNVTKPYTPPDVCSNKPSSGKASTKNLSFAIAGLFVLFLVYLF